VKKLIFAFFLAALFALAVLFLYHSGAQEPAPTDCLPFTWGEEITAIAQGRLVNVPLSVNVWNELQDFTGPSFWLGYDNGGFDLPRDASLVFVISGRSFETNERFAIYALYSADTNRFYWLTFANLTPHADRNGNHYGVHPCSAITTQGAPVAAWLLYALSDNRAQD
jgi:hypothetical protein